MTDTSREAVEQLCKTADRYLGYHMVPTIKALLAAKEQAERELEITFNSRNELAETWKARAEQAERERDEARAATIRYAKEYLEAPAQTDAEPVAEETNTPARAAFWRWLDLAYRDGSTGSEPKFTKYNMKVAFSAGWEHALVATAQTDEARVERLTQWLMQNLGMSRGTAFPTADAALAAAGPTPTRRKHIHDETLLDMQASPTLESR